MTGSLAGDRPSHPATTGPQAMLAALLEARTGQLLAPARMWRVDATLRPLMTEQGCETVDALVRRLLAGNDPRLADRITDLLVNQETSFFRDAGIIETVATAMSTSGAAHRARIWCAGCSTGQEPLSLAMLFAEDGSVRPDIVATDVSEAALARARTGRYTQFEVQRGLPIRRLMRWFMQVEPDWQASQDLLRAVTYRRSNLVADAPPPGRFDAILCRNVLFYLPPATRTAVLERLWQAVRPGGLLVLGAGETVIGQTDRFVPSQRHRGFYEAVPERVARRA